MSTSKLARLVRKSLSRQWECMSVEEQDVFCDGVSRQRKVESTNSSPSMSADLYQHGRASSFLAVNGVHCVSSLAENGCAAAGPRFQVSSDADSGHCLFAATSL